MAANEANVNKVFASLGARLADAFEAVKDVPVNTGMGVGFPAGVNGVAQLTIMEFIEGKKAEDKGKWYFRAAGVCVSPAFHEGIKCAGKHTSVLIPMHDTPNRTTKSFAVPDKDGRCHFAKVRDLFAKFGVESPPSQQPGESKEAMGQRIAGWMTAAMAILLKQRPHFEFRTWKGEKATEGKYAGKEPLVNEQWEGRTEWKPTGAAADPAAGVGPAPSTNGQHAAPASPPSAQPSAAAPPPVQQPQAPPPAPATQPASATDAQLDAWAEAADSDPDMVTDEAVQAKDAISAACGEYGVTNDEAKVAADWKAVVALVKARRTLPTTTVATSANGVYAKGQQVQYKGQACEVTSVAADARKVTLKVVGGKSVFDAANKLLKVDFSELS